MVLGQCTFSLQEEIHAHSDHEAASINSIELLHIIHSILHSVDSTGHSNLADSYCEIKKMWFALKQGHNQSMQKWNDCVCNGVNVLKYLNIKVTDKAIITQVTTASGRPGAPNQANCEAAEERSYAVQFIHGSCFTDYKRHLKNMMLKGTNWYPMMLLDAYTILQRWESLPAGTMPGNDGIALRTNTGSPGAAGYEGDTNNNNQYVFVQQAATPIPDSWLVLNSAATDTVFCNSQMLSVI